jgi:hypothetical protein
MLWMMRMVLLAMGLQTCGLHSDSLQSWPYCGRVSLSRPLALVSPSGSPATVVFRPCRMGTSPAGAVGLAGVPGDQDALIADGQQTGGWGGWGSNP